MQARSSPSSGHNKPSRCPLKREFRYTFSQRCQRDRAHCFPNNGTPFNPRTGLKRPRDDLDGLRHWHLRLRKVTPRNPQTRWMVLCFKLVWDGDALADINFYNIRGKCWLLKYLHVLEKKLFVKAFSFSFLTKIGGVRLRVRGRSRIILKSGAGTKLIAE